MRTQNGLPRSKNLPWAAAGRDGARTRLGRALAARNYSLRSAPCLPRSIPRETERLPAIRGG